MADIIKKVKIKKQDGSYTDYIPIGAEAKNISTAEGVSVEHKLNNKPYYFNNVEELKNTEFLKDGDIVITLGYYKNNDGGKATYIIKKVTNANDIDEIITLSLKNKNLMAKLCINDDTINIKQLGVITNAQENNNSAIINQCIQKNIATTFFFPKDTYYFNEPISVKKYMNFIGDFDFDYLLDQNSKKMYFTKSNAFINCDKNIFKGLALYGDKTISGENMAFSRGTTGNAPLVDKCAIFNFKRGFYGNDKSFHISNNIIKICTTGISNVTDSKIINNTISLCQDGISLYGQGDDQIINNRIEWNTRYGIYINNGWHHTISNNLIDRNSQNGIFATNNAHRCIINSNMLRRNYADATGNNEGYSHIYCEDCNHFNINGNMTDNDNTMDQQTGIKQPPIGLNLKRCQYFNVSANDFTGSNTKSLVLSNYSKRIYLEDVTNAIDNIYYTIDNGNTQTYTLPLTYIPDLYTLPFAIKLYISYRDIGNKTFNVIEKIIPILNNGTYFLYGVKTFEDNKITFTVQKIVDNALNIDVVNNYGDRIALCMSYQLLTYPFNSSYTENDYEIEY